jgi:hypothetical protein
MPGNFTAKRRDELPLCFGRRGGCLCFLLRRWIYDRRIGFLLLSRRDYHSGVLLLGRNDYTSVTGGKQEGSNS